MQSDEFARRRPVGFVGKGEPQGSPSPSDSLPAPLSGLVPQEVQENAGQYFLLSGLVLAFMHRDKILKAVRRVTGRK